jgi:FkbM family methyltransferase
MLIKNIARKLLAHFDYVLWKKKFFRYGISPFVDIKRLNDAWCQSIDTFFDVGANIGQTSKLALEEFGSARVYAFEPHPTTFNKLSQDLIDKRLSVYQLAFGEKISEVTLYEYGSSGDGSLINSLVPDARFPAQFGYSAAEIKVKCTTIDDFCKSNAIDRIDVLKIDTEGFDFSVIKGAQNMLREHKIKFIYTEFNDLVPKANTTGGSLLPIAEYLAEFGFSFISTYTDFVIPGTDVFVCANALFFCSSADTKN